MHNCSLYWLAVNTNITSGIKKSKLFHRSITAKWAEAAQYRRLRTSEVRLPAARRTQLAVCRVSIDGFLALRLSVLDLCGKFVMGSVTEWWILGVLALAERVDRLCAGHGPFQWMETCSPVCSWEKHMALQHFITENHIHASSNCKRTGKGHTLNIAPFSEETSL